MSKTVERHALFSACNGDAHLSRARDPAFRLGEGRASGIVTDRFNGRKQAFEQGAHSTRQWGKLAIASAFALLALAACAGNETSAVDPDHNVQISTSGARIAIDEASEGARITVADTQPGRADTYIAMVNASGSGSLTFEFVSPQDMVILDASSRILGFERIEIVRGTVDLRNVRFPEELSAIRINSGVIMESSQFAHLREISGTGRVSISIGEAHQFDQVISGLQARLSSSISLSIETQNAIAATVEEAARLVSTAEFLGDFVIVDSIDAITSQGTINGIEVADIVSAADAITVIESNLTPQQRAMLAEIATASKGNRSGVSGPSDRSSRVPGRRAERGNGACRACTDARSGSN